MTSAIELITIHELLRDPQYREYFLKSPSLPDHYRPQNLPWKLIVMKKDEGIWRSKRFGTYGEAFAGLKSMLPLITNGAINCPPLGFAPPMKNYRVKGRINPKTKKPVVVTKVWVPRIEADMEPHNWCTYCRRPSIFRLANLSRPAKGGYSMIQGEPALRCIICGASERIVNLRHPEIGAQKWDPTRVRIHTLA